MSTNYRVVPRRQGKRVETIAGHIQHAVREPYLLDTITKDKIRAYVNEINEILNGRMLGLNCGGWVFGFRAYPNLRSWTDWKHHIINNDLSILSEYDEEISLVEFEKTVLIPSLSGKHVRHEDDVYRLEWQDSEGYDFGDYEFS
jgi:hypothetical protein